MTHGECHVTSTQAQSSISKSGSKTQALTGVSAEACNLCSPAFVYAFARRGDKRDVNRYFLLPRALKTHKELLFLGPPKLAKDLASDLTNQLHMPSTTRDYNAA